MNAPAGIGAADRMKAHKINGCLLLSDTGWDGVTCRLEEAHAILAVIESAIDQGEGEFGQLNRDLQRKSVQAVQHLIAEADYHAHELMRQSDT